MSAPIARGPSTPDDPASVAAADSSSYTTRAILEAGWRRRRPILLTALAVAAAASWWIQRLPDRYRAEALLLAVPQRVPETFVRSTVPTRVDLRLPSITQQILSRTQLEAIIRDFDLYAERRATDPMEEVVETMRERDLEIRPVKGDAFRLGFTADSPQVARQVVDRLVSLFIVETTLDRASQAEGTDQFLEAQLEDARRRLIDNESKLDEYRRRHSGALPSQLEANVRGLHNTEMQLQAIADALNRDRDRQLVLERSVKDAELGALIEAREAGSGAGPSTLSTAEQLARAEAALDDLQSTLTAQHPDVIAMTAAVAELRKRASAEGTGPSGANAAEQLRRSRLEGLRAELAAIEQQIVEKTAEEARLRRVLAAYQRRIEGTPAREAELAALTRDYDTLQQTYRSLLARKQDSAIAANLERQQMDAHFKVLDPARLPEQPFAPRRARLHALALLTAFGLGLMVAVALECFDRSLRTEEAVRHTLGLPVLAAIPQVSPRRRFRGRSLAAGSIGAAILAGAAALAWRLWL